MSRLLVSATHKSSGKTIFTTALIALLKAHGANPIPYKKGPDYIDPQWLSAAAGGACYNLDFNVQSNDEIIAMVADKSPPGTIAVIEANKGLYDGVSLDGSNSNAALAELLKCPILLVVDCEGMTRGIAPLLLGYDKFVPELSIGGVILNQVGGSRHQSKLIAAVERYTDIPVMGAVMKDKALSLPERHLGLIPANEATDASQFIETLSACIAPQIDLEKIMQLAARATPLAHTRHKHEKPNYEKPNYKKLDADIRIGVFRDSAFNFYYPDDLETLERCGVELVFINSLTDSRLPPINGLFIGGGFPETQASALEANRALRHAVAEAIEDCMPVYAECGGLMYLTKSIHWQGRRFEMCGVIDADTQMHETPQGRGYVKLNETDGMIWGGQGEGNTSSVIHAHEFHYSRLVDIKQSYPTAYKISRGAGLGNGHDGIVYKNLLAAYTHQRNTCGRWAERFSDFVRSNRRLNQ